jgi:ATP-binding cassette subfamily B protein RaxB
MARLLAMIAGRHGHHTDLSALRARFAISLKGINLSHLVQHANSLELSARGLRLGLEELAQLAAPCILHWDLNHLWCW